MGYNTEFKGYIAVTPPIASSVVELWNSLAMSTELRDSRNIGTEWPEQAPTTEKGFGYHCQWELKPGDERTSIWYDGGEKFYDYTWWLQYLINVVLKYEPGARFQHLIQWRGEDFDDFGTLWIDSDNFVHADRGVFN